MTFDCCFSLTRARFQKKKEKRKKENEKHKSTKTEEFAENPLEPLETQ